MPNKNKNEPDRESLKKPSHGRAKPLKPGEGTVIGPQDGPARDWTPNPGAEDIIREQRGRHHQSTGIQNPIMPDPERSL